MTDLSRLTAHEVFVILKTLKVMKDYFVREQDFEGAAELRNLINKIENEKTI